jgi:uncharacterized protein (DUF1499 family)
MRWIHDVSTDTDDPPQFIALREVRLACPNGADYSGLHAAEHQLRYNELRPAVFEGVQPATVYGAALAVVNAMQWKVAVAVESEGRIEATATTRIMRFKDDVVIRIRAAGRITRVDVRSASRVGSSDLGANAKRLGEFLRKVNNYLKSNTYVS